MNENIIPTPYREFRYTAFCTTNNPTTELMQILAQAMDSYSNLVTIDRFAVVNWFQTSYGKPEA